jgi:peptide methionine sulfoxide reductase msrA/msrB
MNYREYHMKKIIVSGILIMLMATGLFATDMERAIFAGGCFWCMEPPFEKLDGVKSVVSGYSGGTGANPVYRDYSKKGHTEVVEITFDPSKITYAELLDVFWHQVDPTDAYGQFCDRGKGYRPGIFYLDDDQQKLAEASRQEIEKSGILDKPITLEITRASKFYAAESYHQDFYKKNPGRYYSYRAGCGRDRILDSIWGKERFK